MTLEALDYLIKLVVSTPFETVLQTHTIYGRLY
jgi:hypothetical protein